MLCIFKCVKHHACLAGPWDSRWKRDRLCFLSHGDFAFGLPLPLCWLVDRVSKKPYRVFPFTFSVHKEQNTHFPPAQGNARKRKCTKPQCKKQRLLHCRAFSQQTGRLHTHIGNCKTKKRNSQAHILECLRIISVPANLLPAGTIMKACCCRRPHTCHRILRMGHLPSFFCPVYPDSRVHENKNTVEVNLHLW